MRVDVPDEWPRTPAEAAALQDELRPLVRAENPAPPRFSTAAGIDSAYAEDGTVATAAVVLDLTTMETVETAVAQGISTFPYVPGLLAFRELPATVAALGKLTGTPDLLVCDAQGIAHPRRFGLACHIGLLTGIPTIGVAKSVWGEYEPPGPRRGDVSDIRIDGEVVGRALRTRDEVKPLFVSVGHLIDLDTACAQVLALTQGFRQPETTRRADHLCRAALRAATAG
ncbi:endonuclease V [Nocardia neocaledoniensis NBRC 108232]|uniref:Endonuclease V n=1 Tax=Nocardia neocaledoniensis TaxID=236511 RepID=A0A317NYR1_9NOCA|nr:endonuclease V [Nocardia neocaledoniensis]PWV79284.1 endonuclease V [Nocardia neocaledoniensis]GEM30724.1 endonuclease V [Nocardia neocaledoniensis NBRC 108232]